LLSWGIGSGEGIARGSSGIFGEDKKIIPQFSIYMTNLLNIWHKL
jgi:hypothetical protein